MIRRKRLFVRQSLAFREGQSVNSSWSVGYWDRKGVHADQAFRVFFSKPTRQEAELAAEEFVKSNKQYFF
jgi:hypothetical protein